MYITGTKFNFINRLHELPTGIVDLQSFEGELPDYAFSGVAEVHVVNKINNEFSKKYYVFTLDASYLTGVYAYTGVVNGNPPVLLLSPIVSGFNYVGATLYTTNGNWQNNPTSYSYQWQKNYVNIAGATSTTYIIPTGETGNLRCVIIANNAAGTGSSNSNTANILPDNYIRNYTFDNVSNPLLDSGTMNVTGVVRNGTGYFANSCMQFTGQSYLDAGLIDNLGYIMNNSSLVIDMNVRVTGNGFTQRLFGMRNTPVVTGDTIAANVNFYRNGTTSVNNATGAFSITIRAGNQDGYVGITGGTTLGDGSWHNFKTIFTPYVGQVDFYIDNQLITNNKSISGVFSGQKWQTTNANFYFGAVSNISTGFSGEMDNIKIYTSGFGNRPHGYRYNYGPTKALINNSLHNAFPSVGVWRKNDSYNGRIVTVYRSDVNHDGESGVLYLQYSDTNGSGWSNPIAVISGTNQDYREGGFHETSTGDLILLTYWRDPVNKLTSGNSEIYRLSWPASGTPNFSLMSTINAYQNGYLRIKHPNAIVEKGNLGWFCSADGTYATGLNRPLFFNSTDLGLTWNLLNSPGSGAGILNTNAKETSIINDPYNPQKLWYHVREDAIPCIHRFYAFSGEGYSNWYYQDKIINVFGSPRGRIIDGTMMFGLRDGSSPRQARFIYSYDAQTFNSIGAIGTGVYTGILDDMMTYSQIVKTNNGKILMIHGTQNAAGTNGDILQTEIVELYPTGYSG